jgi:quinol monooxygenase YgiN
VAAFETHLHTAHVQQFMASVPTLSTNGFDALVQLGEIPVR